MDTDLLRRTTLAIMFCFVFLHCFALFIGFYNISESYEFVLTTSLFPYLLLQRLGLDPDSQRYVAVLGMLSYRLCIISWLSIYYLLAYFCAKKILSPKKRLMQARLRCKSGESRFAHAQIAIIRFHEYLAFVAS